MGLIQTLPSPALLPPFLSKKLRFWSFTSMLCLVYVHGFNLDPPYAQPWTLMREPLTFDAWLQFFLANGVLRFRIPLLFAISGYLFAWHDGVKPYEQQLRKRWRTLGIPYLLWTGLWWLVAQAMKYSVTHKFPNITLASLAAMQPVDLILGILQPVPYQLWFLRSLLVYALVYPWLRAAILRVPLLYFSVAGLLWFFMVPLWPVAEGDGLLFFGLGIWLAFRNQDLAVPPGWYRPLLFGLVWIGAAAVKTSLAFGSGALVPASMLVLHKIGEVTGLLTAWFCFDGLVRWSMARGWFRWLTRFSFMIYVLHVPAVSYVNDLFLHHVTSYSHGRLAVYIVAPLLVAVGSVALGAALRRAMPGIYAMLTGGRGLATS